MYYLPPPTVAEARFTVQYVFKPYTDTINADLHVSKDCPRRGHSSRVCRARVTGPHGGTYRIVVTSNKSGWTLSGT